MAVEPQWPQADAQIQESAKLLFQAKLDLEKERVKAAEAAEKAGQLEQLKSDLLRVSANETAKQASIAAFHNNLFEVSKGAIDRARAGAETVQKAAAAIGTAYTTVLALSFSVAERPLPSRGLVPTILFGAAVVWSTVYLAYLSKGKGVLPPAPTTSFETGAMRRSVAFIEWTRSGAFNRKFALHVSVFALAFGLALLPAPFVDIGGSGDGDDPPSAASSPAWPKTPKGKSELRKVRYEAEVKEVAELRSASKPIVDDGNDSVWWKLCILALALSLALPASLWGWERLRE